MKTARIILALLFVMGVVATLFSKIENSGKFAPAKIPDKIYFEEHDGSSVYSKYKIRQERTFCFSIHRTSANI